MSDMKKTIEKLNSLLPYHEGEKFRVIEMCAVALEKQIARTTEKDIVVDEDYSGSIYEREIPVCPSCNNIYLMLKQSYCNQCGQKLDWRVEK